MELIFLALVFLLAGIIPELTGFGVATISMSLLPFALPFATVLPVVTIMSVITTGIITVQSRTKSMLKGIIPLVFSSAVGIHMGMQFLSAINAGTLMKAFGLFLVLYSIYGLVVKKEIIHFKKGVAVLVGFIAGFFSASFNIHGPLVGIYESSNTHLSKIELKNTIAAYMFITGLLTLIGHITAGRVTAEVIELSVFSLPFLLTGLAIGTKLFGKIQIKMVKYLVYILTLVVGVILLAR